jgi:arginine utilization protein RocB
VRSKARLIEAAHELCESGENRYYFPSFELVQEDLRDYRFYTKDMAHPSEQAIEYIWQYFQNSLWDDETKIISQKISNLQKSFNHRILHPENEQYKSFVTHTLKKAMELEQAHPFINFDKEKCEMMKDND